MFQSALLFAQEPIFKNISNDFGVPSSEIYNVFQDSKHYIWFSTEAGLCRFNGNKITVYDLNKGLPEKACYGICENPQGKLWFITAKNRVLYHDEVRDRLIEARFTKNLQIELGKLPTSQIYSIQTFNDSTLWINAQWVSFSVNINTNKIEVKKPIDDGNYHFIQNESGLFPFKIASWDFAKNFNGRLIHLTFHGDKPFQFSMKWENPHIPQWRCLTAKNGKGETFIGWDNYLLKITRDNHVEVHRTKGSILSLFCSTENDLWVGCAKSGILKFENSVFDHATNALDGLSISGILKDQEGGIWCSSIEKGLFYCQNEYVLQTSFTESLATRQELFKSINDRVFSSSVLGEIVEVSSLTGDNKKMFQVDGQLIRDIEPFKEGYLIIGYKGLAWVNKGFQKLHFYSDKSANNFKGGIDIEVNAQRRVFFIQNGALYELTEQEEIIPRIKVLPQGATCIESDGETLYLGTKEGLYIIDTQYFKFKKNAVVAGYVSAILKIRSNEFVVITKDNGIYFGSNNKFINRTQSLNLGGYRLFDMDKDEDGNLWIASNMGLLKISRGGTSIFNHIDGLPADEIFNVAYAKGYVYFNTNDGVYKFKSNADIEYAVAPKIYLHKVLLNSIAIPKLTKEFDYYQNNLSFEFDALTFRNLKNIRLLVELSGSLDTSFIVNSNRLDLFKLDPGSYRLNVFALNSNGVRSTMPFTFKFQVKSPFWKRPLYIILFVLIVAIIITLFVLFVIRRIKKKENDKTQLNRLIAEYQLTALQSQMNPHFIFNAINSIQTFILENETQPAYDYLSKFAKLIRMVLNNAKNQFQSLDKELELLKLYIELEQLRFENRFNYEISVDQEIDLVEFELPPLLIQPFVENAIWHGLMPLEKHVQGKLKIAIEKMEDSVLINVEDNGIGRERSMQSKRNPEHHSMGMELSKNRVEISNSLVAHFSVDIEIKDLKDEHGYPSGTRVQIIIKGIHGEG